MKKTITKTEKAKTTMPSFVRVAAYARVSSVKDELLHSLAAQVSYYSSYIQNHPGWSYAGVYTDEAVTGTKDNRPEFRRLLEACRKKEIDLVMTKSISRFARNTVDFLEAIRELKDLGVDVFFEEQNIHTLSGDGELLITILASYAQEESRSVSENQKWRIRKNYKEGLPSNHSRVYGYDHINGNLKVVPEEAEVIRRIYRDYLNGMGKNAIMKKLIQENVPTKNGGQWRENGVAKILKNEKYIGDMLLQKGYVADHLSKRWKRNNGELAQYYVKNHHEPIIDQDTFNAVQNEMESRADKKENTRQKHSSEFTGLIHCQRCGARFIRKTYACNTKYEKVTWTCSTFVSHGKQFCEAKRIPEDILKQKCKEVLGIQMYDPAVLSFKIEAIIIPEDGILNFIFKDGTERTVRWEYRSRRESWTDEMRDTAREHAKRRW